MTFRRLSEKGRRADRAGRELVLASVLALLMVPLTGVSARAAAAPEAAATALHGQWISHPSWSDVPVVGAATPAMPVWVKDFPITRQIASAQLVVAGPGVINVSVNGRPASADVLGLGYTTESARLWSKAVDVTPLLTTGSNRIGVQMAGGMADVGVPNRYFKLQRSSTPLTFAASLNMVFTDGSVASVDTDTTWLTTLSGTAVADWFGGEDFDPSVLPGNWTTPGVAVPGLVPAVPPTSLPGGASAVTPVIGPGQQVVDELPAASVTALDASTWVVDLGRQMAGWPKLSVTGTAGSVVRMFPAEQLHADGTFDQGSMGASRAAPVYDQYTLTGAAQGETWHPQFVYHGFRYIQVQVLPGGVLTTAPVVSGLEIETVLDPAGNATYSDPTFTALDALTRQSARENLQSMITDCPDREKLGWLEQTWLVFDTLSSYYDMSVYGRRMERIIADAQLPSGLVPSITPEAAVFGGPFRDDVWWGQAVVQVPWKLYQTYADTATLTTYWPNMVAYTAYVRGHTTEGLIAGALGDWTTQGTTDKALVANIGQYELLDTMAQIATVLGKPSEAVDYRAQANTVGVSINARWKRGTAGTATYGADQASNALALDAGLVPAADVQGVRAAMISALSAYYRGALSGGEIGIPAIMRQLTAAGRADLLVTAIRRTDRPGYGYIVASGATALTEYWQGNHTHGSSQAHVMNGYVVAFAQEHLAGLAQAVGSTAWSKVTIAPQLVPQMTSATITRNTGNGQLTVSWARIGGQIVLTAALPNGVSGTVVLPSGTVPVGPGSTTIRSTDAQAFTLVADPGGLGGGTRTFAPPQLPTPPDPTPPDPGPTHPVVYSAHGVHTLYVVSAGAATALSYQQWVAIGKPAPIRPTAAFYTKYSWSPVVYVTSELGPSGPRITAAETYADWRAENFPPVSVDAALIPGSSLVRYATGPELILTSPDATTHKLTGAEWRALGNPGFSNLSDQGWIQLPGGPRILAVTSLTTGAAHPATMSEWVLAGHPTPATTPRPGQLRAAQWVIHRNDPRIYLVLTGSAPIHITAAEWAAAGYPAPTRL